MNIRKPKNILNILSTAVYRFPPKNLNMNKRRAQLTVQKKLWILITINPITHMI